MEVIAFLYLCLPPGKASALPPAYFRRSSRLTVVSASEIWIVQSGRILGNRHIGYQSVELVLPPPNAIVAPASTHKQA